MTKSKKQRQKEARQAHEKHNLMVLGAAIASVIILVFALAA